MAWTETFLQASFRGVPFDILDVSRASQRAIAENEYPFVDGADLDDLGQRGRRVRLRAIFFGNDYEQRLDAFCDALDVAGTGELIHPIHGIMQVVAEAWEDLHEADLVDGCIVSVSFVQDQTRSPVFSTASATATTDAVATQVSSARGAADLALARQVARIPTLALRRITFLKDNFNQAKAALSALMRNTTGIKLLLSDLDPLIYPQAYAADLLAIVDRGLQGLPFGGRNLLFDGNYTGSGSGAADFATVRKLLDPAVLTVTPAAQAVDVELRSDAALVQAHARVHAACGVAEAANIVLAGELEAGQLERADVEAISNQTRSALQVAIDGARAALDAEGRSDLGTALRAAAFAIEEAARAVINQRPPLVRKPAPVSGPVRLVAHAIYGDATRAQEVVRLNRLGRSVMVNAGEVLNVYAS